MKVCCCGLQNMFYKLAFWLNLFQYFDRHLVNIVVWKFYQNMSAELWEFRQDKQN